MRLNEWKGSAQHGFAGDRRCTLWSSGSASDPAAADRRMWRFRFVIEDSPHRDASAKRRETVAKHVVRWCQSLTVSEGNHGRDGAVWIEFLRAPPRRDRGGGHRRVPHCLRGTFAWLGGQCFSRRDDRMPRSAPGKETLKQGTWRNGDVVFPAAPIERAAQGGLRA